MRGSGLRRLLLVPVLVAVATVPLTPAAVLLDALAEAARLDDGHPTDATGLRASIPQPTGDEPDLSRAGQPGPRLALPPRPAALPVPLATLADAPLPISAPRRTVRRSSRPPVRGPPSPTAIV